MRIEFEKWHGCGNDFVMIEDMRDELAAAVDLPKLAIKLCDRHFGVGADGIILILPSARADFRMRIINNDGSEAEMCGNGIRCFAAEVYAHGLTDKTEFTVETLAGIKTPRLLFDDGKLTAVRVDMGAPILAGDDIPVAGYGREKVIAAPITVAGREYRMTCVSMGNPHCVVFVDSEAELAIAEQVGADFEVHEKFPRHINTEFVYVRDRANMRMRVWERGAHITLACGTGTCATIAAAVLEGRTDRRATIVIDGGQLELEWSAENDHIYMTGAATRVFAGTTEEI